MRKIQIVGAFIAVLAFSALAVSSASATLWLDHGASPLGAETAASHGVLEFHHVVLGIETKVRCSGLLLGKVGPGNKDLVELAQELSGTNTDLITCENVVGCSAPILHILNLPWNTELLLLTNGKTDDHFFEDGKGLPKLEILCSGGLKISCESLINVQFDENLANGALFLFLKEGTETKNCSDSGTSWITGMGEQLLFTVS